MGEQTEVSTKRRGENSAPSGKGLAPPGVSRQRLSYLHREQLNIGHRADILYYVVSILPSFLHLLENASGVQSAFLSSLNSPSLRARSAACIRSETSSLLMTCSKCVFTVDKEILNSCIICRLVFPTESNSKISSSLGVNFLRRWCSASSSIGLTERSRSARRSDRCSCWFAKRILSSCMASSSFNWASPCKTVRIELIICCGV